MIRRIRHWLRLPLLTRHERKMLNDFWWAMVTKNFPNIMRDDMWGQEIPLADKFAVTYIIDEFADAIDWLEELKA